MTHNRSPPQTAAGPPILDCPRCSPKRPMILKNIKGSFRKLTVIYECAQCGATQEAPPSLEVGADPATGTPRLSEP